MTRPKKTRPEKTFDPKRLPDIKPTYTVSLTIGEDTYEASSDDITEAILGLKPSKISNRVLFSLEHDGMKSKVMRTVPACRRIISNRMTALLTGRALLMLLK